MDGLLYYIAIGIIGILAVFSFVIGVQQMVKVILGNYVLGIICMAASQSIDILISFLQQNSTLSFFGIGYDNFASFFSSGKVTLVLLLYAIGLIIVYKKSTIYIRFPEDPNIMKGIQIILVPMTVMSMILTLQMAILGINMIDVVKLKEIVSHFAQSGNLYNFLRLGPVRLLLHGVLTTVITSELKISVRTE